MEGEPENSDGIQRDEEPVVIWEKYIQQNIIVDLSEDESLHLSDLESSFAFHISKAESAASETSIHLSGSAALSDYDSSSESVVSRHESDMVIKKTSSSVLCKSFPRPNTVQDVPSLNRDYEDPGQNTSDEDHEDLPYDGHLGSLYFNQVAHLACNNNQNGKETSSDVPDFIMSQVNNPIIKRDAGNEQLALIKSIEKAETCLHKNSTTDQDNDLRKPNEEPCPQQKLLSKDDLLRSGRLIEAETLPEVSLLESMDETVFSKASLHDSMPDYGCCDLPSVFVATQSGCPKQKINIANVNFVETEETNKEATSSPTECLTSNSANFKQSISGHMSDQAKEEVKEPKVPLLRTHSFSEIKYGQGQVHYPLPDFSKVSPKVKIPSVSKGSPKLTQQPPGIHRAHSSPEILDVVNRILEESVITPEQPCAFSNQDKQPSALVQHLQDKYDTLLAKYAEAENLIDQMRLGTNKSASELQLCFEEDQDYLAEGSLVCPLSQSALGSSNLMTDKMNNKIQTALQHIEKEAISLVQPEVTPSDGEVMTAELNNIISHFMQNVEEFKFNVSKRSISTAEQQMMLRGLMEAQDQLERKYMSKKEEHRALEMQNYLGICRNTGTFDPDRLVEGDIFRIGMFLEDIKEIIDKNVCEQISPPQTSSTPSPHNFKINLFCTSSPSLSLHEEHSKAVSPLHHEVDEEKQEATALVGHLEGQLMQSNKFVNTRLSENMETPSCYSRSSHTSLHSSWNASAGDDKEQESLVSGPSNILTDVNPGEGPSVNRSIQDSPLNPECDLGNCVSLSVERLCSRETSKDWDNVSEPPLNTSVSQRYRSPETDSGFGSSYLNQSASGSFQQNLDESFHSQNVSSSDSEGSCSNLQTTIEPATLTTAPWTQPSVRLEPHGALKQCIPNTAKEPLFRLQGTKHRYLSEPILDTTMDTTGSSLYPCSCNNETIIALQSEVARLKKDMKEGLVQLPYLAEKLDYLTTKYRHERTTKSRSRSHKSPIKSPSIENNLSNAASSPVKLDWISTDIDPSQNKETDSEDTVASGVLQFDFSPIGGTGDRAPSALAQRWFPLYSSPIQKPLLQVNYGSSSSLPASYKLREPLLQPSAHEHKRSTQSDTALLPSDVFFQQTLSPFSAPSKLGNRTSKHSGSKNEELHRTLDQAIEVARSIKHTTDRMAKSLSADLAKAKHRKSYSVQPLRGRKQQAL